MKMPSLLSRLLGRDAPPVTDLVPRDIGDALLNPQSGLGTWRDKRSYSEYSPAIPLTDYQLEAMYTGAWLPPAIVATPAEDMTREWVRAKWEGQEKGDAAKVEQSVRRLALKPKSREALTWTRLYGGSVIGVDIRGQDPKEPLNLATIKKGSLQGLHVYDRTWVDPVGSTVALPGPNVGLPEYYRLRESGVIVHCSRLVRFEGRNTPYSVRLRQRFWHDSELQHVVTAVKDFDGAFENAASMLWEAKIDVITTALGKWLDKPGGKAAMQLRYQEAMLGKSNHRTLFIDKDEKYDAKTLAFGGVHDILGDFVIAVCGAAKIPMVKLFGQSAPGMNSTGDTDLRLYYDHIAAEAEWQLLPPLTYLYEVIIRDALGMMPEGFELKPNPLWQVSDKDQAEIDFKKAQAAKVYVDMGAIVPWHVTRALKAAGAYDLEDEDIELAKELELAIEPVPGAPVPDPNKPNTNA